MILNIERDRLKSRFIFKMPWVEYKVELLRSIIDRYRESTISDHSHLRFHIVVRTLKLAVNGLFIHSADRYFHEFTVDRNKQLIAIC